MRIIRRAREVWRHKQTVQTIDSSIAYRTWDTFFEDLKGWKKIHYISVVQQNDEVAAKNVIVKCTVDGVPYANDASIASNTTEFIHRDSNRGIATEWGTFTGLSYNASLVLALLYESLMCESIKIEATLNTAVGTNQLIVMRTVYSELEVV